MFKVTVMYNLAPCVDHDAFVQWRMTEHQADNAAGEGVLRTDFYIAEDTPLGEPKFRYITEVYYRTRDDLERDFLSDESQRKIAAWIDEHQLADFTAIVSEQYAETIVAGCDCGRLTVGDA